MIRLVKYFRISMLTSVLPLCIYLFLYWYPSFSYFSYVDHLIFPTLWDMRWLRFIRFISAPLSIILFIRMFWELRINEEAKKKRMLVNIQLAIMLAYMLYWIFLFRVIFMI
ncbi:hypothetical protein BH09BAC5_BH09BAC5_23270 [soil metagenome]